MSYLVLARKWRPKDFSEMVGQEHVLQALTNALDSERLHHAYLFAGTRGVGKTTIARILAKSLNCEKGVSSAPCGKCGACLEIDEGRFVDLIEVDAASRTKVDDTRELLDNVQYAPARGRYKVYLIDEVHMLSKSSFNALLKTLEEPPPHVKFLLATTDPQKLPVTVLSRCLQFNLKRLTPKLIRDRLAYICDAEDIQFEPRALAMLASAADGSLRDALSLLDQAIAYCGGSVVEDQVGHMLGTIDDQHIDRMLQLLAEGDAPAIMAAVNEIDELFPDYGRLLDEMARVLQRIAVYQVVGSVESEDELADGNLDSLASSLDPADVQLFYQTALIGKRDLHLAPDPRSGAEMTLLRMLAFKPPGSQAHRSGGNMGQQKSAAPGNTPAAARPTTVSRNEPDQAAVKTATVSDWQDPVWSELVPHLDLAGASKLLANNCAYVRRNKATVYLNLDARSESLLTKSRQKSIAQSLTQHFGESLNVEISLGETGTETPLQEKARQNDEKLDAARQALESDPNIQALKDRFGAELHTDSVEVIQSGAESN